MAFKVDIPDDSPFTLHNIPFGVISTDSDPQRRCATAVGKYALDLSSYWKYQASRNSELIPFRCESLYEVFSQPHLNAFAALPAKDRARVREYLIDELRSGDVPQSCFFPLDVVQLHLPMQIGGYSDFFCSLEHCENCSPMTGGVAQNFFHAPCVYNGRVSSIVASSQSLHRPMGVMYDSGGRGGKPVYRASQKMDFELEMGFFVSKPIPFGETMNIQDAAEHIFGFVLLNDWSSRDIQAFEMNPLGPFHSKGFCTSISPWIITLDALKPFACESRHDHSANDFAHLQWRDKASSTLDIQLTASLIRNHKKYKVATSNLRYLYWSPYQQLSHHASAGCGLGTGDLLGTGTISGTGEGELGCLFEATFDGSKPIRFEDGTVLSYLNDLDEVVLEGWCGTGERRIGFGQCKGIILAIGKESKE